MKLNVFNPNTGISVTAHLSFHHLLIGLQLVFSVATQTLVIQVNSESPRPFERETAINNCMWPFKWRWCRNRCSRQQSNRKYTATWKSRFFFFFTCTTQFFLSEEFAVQEGTKPHFNKWPELQQSIVCLDFASSPAICMTACIPFVPNFRPRGTETLPVGGGGGLNWLLQLKWRMVSLWKAIHLALLINTCNKSDDTFSLSPHWFPVLEAASDQCLYSMGRLKQACCCSRDCS